jgi:NAD(P)-dependent dehydrogenase (short-subunit alcohol dehydrogenase family)
MGRTKLAFKAFDLTGKVALITGGNRGIGLGMAHALAEAGSGVVIWGTNQDANRKAEEELSAHGVDVFSQMVDIADEAAVVDAMKETVRRMGRIDTFIANAGVGERSASFLEMPVDKYRRTMAVNLDGAVWCLREACRAMVARAKAGDPGGSIIGLSSIAAIQGVARNQAYSATKAAVLALIKSIAVEYARYGIRANAILPGWIATERTEWARASDKVSDAIISRVPARRWGKPEDFGGIAVYLASEASAYHSGDSFVIDGAYSIF